MTRAGDPDQVPGPREEGAPAAAPVDPADAGAAAEAPPDSACEKRFCDTEAGRLSSRTLLIWALIAVACLAHLVLTTRTGQERLLAHMGVLPTLATQLALALPFPSVLALLAVAALVKERYLRRAGVRLALNGLFLVAVEGLHHLYVAGLYAPLIERLK